MAITAIKSTYSLDVATVRRLERIAARWRVSKSEALRRAINAAAEMDSEAATPLEALDKLHASLKLNGTQLEKWSREAARERKSASRRHEWRNR